MLVCVYLCNAHCAFAGKVMLDHDEDGAREESALRWHRAAAAAGDATEARIAQLANERN